MSVENIRELTKFFDECTVVGLAEKKKGTEGAEDLLAMSNNAAILIYYIDKLQQEKGELIRLAEICSELPKLDVDNDTQLVSLRAEGVRALAIAEQSDLGYIKYQPRRNAIIIEHVEELEENQHEWSFSVECRDKDLGGFLTISALRVMELTKLEFENGNKKR